MRTFFYALGGGLGHLTRSLAVVHTLGLKGSARIATSLTPELRRMVRELPAKVELTTVPSAIDPTDPRQVRHWIEGEIAASAPDHIFIDCFPAGILGELTTDFYPELPKTLVTRRVSWSRYRIRCPDLERCPTFREILATEPLGGVQAEDLRALAPEPRLIDLIDEIQPSTRRRLRQLADELRLDRDTVLVVHSGPKSEVSQLLAVATTQASAERIALLCPSGSLPADLPANLQHRECYPVWPLFEQAGQVITAAGANSVRQLKHVNIQHVPVAMDRPLDDQPLRTRTNADPLREARNTARVWRLN